jgi:pilus assembly protein HofO
MDKSLPVWLIPWLLRPGWQLLLMQWAMLCCVGLLLIRFGLHGEWQQRSQLQEQQQQLAQQIDQQQQQLAQLPKLSELEQRLAQQANAASSPEFSTLLQQAGGALQQWRQQEKPAQQTVKLQIDFHGLLRLLEQLPPTQRINQLGIGAGHTALKVQLILQGGADE